MTISSPMGRNGGQPINHSIFIMSKGRKKLPPDERRIRIMFTLPQDVIALLKQQSNASAFVEAAVKEKLERIKEPGT